MTMIVNLDPQFRPLAGETIPYESFVFNGGEPHIRIQAFDVSQEIHVTHRINSFNDLGLLCVTVDALRRMKVKHIHGILPYFPGARQDRVMTDGESLTVKVYADIINRLDLSSLTIVDPHSDVTPALLDRCEVVSNVPFIKRILTQLPDDFVLISPDAGAAKKIHKLAQALGISKVLECSKKRDVVTGALTGFSVPVDSLGDVPCLIVDDICDGGGTFMGLGTELKRKNSGDLYLAVSHGIFSKGLDALGEMFTKIYTTDSIRNLSHPVVSQELLIDILKS